MKIQLNSHYQNVNGVQLAPGEHDVKDGLGKYLVDSGHAVYVDSSPVAPIPHAVDIDLDTLQAEGAITVTHDDGSTSTVVIATDEPEPKPSRKQGKR